MSTFSTVVESKAAKSVKMPGKKKKRQRENSQENAPKKRKRIVKDAENYIDYTSKDHHTEAG